MLNRSHNLNRIVSGCVAIMVCITCVPAAAQVTEGSGTDWLSGKRLLDSKLLPVSVAWTESPLRSQLHLFAMQRQRAIFLDRRVDPTLKQSFQFLDKTTEQIVWQTAEANGLGVARIGDLLYVGPKESAFQLPFVIDVAKKKLSKIAKRETSERKKWLSKSELRWPAGTTTLEISNWFTNTHGISFASELPFDVWPQADWPKLSIVEQLSLVLVGFDSSFELDSDSGSVTFVPFPKLKSGKLKLILPRESKLDLETVSKNFAQLKVRRSGKTLAIAGPIESIAEFQAWLVSRQQLKTDGAFERTFDLNVTAPRGDILATVAQQTGRKLVLEGDVQQILMDRITISLTGASLESLLDECVSNAAIRYELDMSTIRIFASSP